MGEMERLTPKFENDRINSQTIDRETGAYLTFEGGTPERNLKRFSFHLDGADIEFLALENRSEENAAETGLPTLHWQFFEVGIPEQMKDREQEITSLIRQAMKVHGFAYRTDQLDSVTAEFIPP